MVLQRVWLPCKFSEFNSAASVTVDTTEGQLYSVETGSDPFYPRGRVMAIKPGERGDVFGDDDDSDDPDRSEDLVDKNNMEPAFRDFTLCASLCNSATIQRSHEKSDEGKGKWEAHGDATEVALQVVSTATFLVVADTERDN